MLDQVRYESLAARAKDFAFFSLQYAQYGDCRDYSIACDDQNGMLLVQETLDPSPVHWAAADAQALIAMLEHVKRNVSIPLVPKEFVAPLEAAGFFLLGEFADFFNRTLMETAKGFGAHAPRFLRPEQAEEASALSMAVRGQSRGFMGETTEWFREWIQENDVLAAYEGNELAGVCCVSIYNEGTTLWLREIAVAPRFQGRGHGRALVEQAVLYGAGKGARKGFLAADLLNANAIKLYESCGFVRSGEDTEIQMARGDF